jgi:hypothetical protein
MHRDALLAAVLAPIAFVSYLLSLGVRPGFGGTGGRPFLVFSVLLAGVGLLVVEGHRRGLLTPLPVATALLLLAPWIGVGPRLGSFAGGVSPDSVAVVDFLPGVVLVAGTVAVLSGVEYAALRHPDVHEALDVRAGVGSLAVGVLHAATVLGFSGLRFPTLDLVTVGLLAWVTVGLVALGAVPTYVAVHLNRVAPPTVVGAGLVFVLVAPTGGALSFGTIYAVGWVVPLSLSLVAGAAEARFVRQQADGTGIRA